MSVSTNQVICVTGNSGNSAGQGPFINVTLRIANGTIVDASYETYPCPGCHACGKAICDLVKAKSLDEARSIRHEHLLEKVGPLPAHRRHCYGLALLALTGALNHISG